jgi:hypothetical protein
VVSTSIWSAVDKIDTKLNHNEIVQLFSDMKLPTDKQLSAQNNPTDSLSTNSSSCTSTSTKLTASAVPTKILSDKRFNSISIMLSMLPGLDIIVQSIRMLDNHLLNKDQVISLYKQIPSEDEISQVFSRGQINVSLLSKPEHFLYLLSNIPQIGARMDCWQFQLQFHETAQDLTTPFTLINEAIKAIRTSTCLRVILAIVLQVGNYMNGDTSKGQADAFDLNILNRLSMVKSSSEGISLLQFVIEQAFKVLGDEFGQK